MKVEKGKKRLLPDESKSQSSKIRVIVRAAKKNAVENHRKIRIWVEENLHNVKVFGFL